MKSSILHNLVLSLLSRRFCRLAKPDVGGMPRMSASHGRAISAGSLRPNAAALDSKGLTRELGRSSTLTDDGVARSLEQGHGDRFDHFNLGALLEQLQEA